MSHMQECREFIKDMDFDTIQRNGVSFGNMTEDMRTAYHERFHEMLKDPINEARYTEIIRAKYSGVKT